MVPQSVALAVLPVGSTFRLTAIAMYDEPLKVTTSLTVYMLPRT
jgi:hypothetical protein